MEEHRSLLTYIAEAVERYRADRRRNPPQEGPAYRSRLRGFLRWMVPNGGTLLLILVLILTQRVWARPLRDTVNAPGPSATTVNYQGRLADPAGNPLDGNYGMTFSLWDSASGGTLVWGPENHTAVPVSGGLFSVGLGSQTPGGIPTTVWDDDRYLEIAVGGETLAPRELIRSVPIAGMALTVPDGAIGTAQVAGGSITSDKLSATYDGFGTWFDPSDFSPVTGPGWFDIDSLKYRDLSITVARDSVLDLSITATMQGTNGRVGYKIYVDGSDAGTYGGLTTSNQWVPVSTRLLRPVTAGTHTISIKIGSWEAATADLEGSFYFNVLAYGQ